MPARGTVTPTTPARFGLVQRRPAKRSEPQAALQRFVRLEQWNGFVAGDVVRIQGHSARGRHWRFRAHVTNTSNGASWVEVALVEGPAPSRRPAAHGDDGAPESVPRVERIRSFDPDLVTQRWGRLGSRRSRRVVAAAPGSPDAGADSADGADSAAGDDGGPPRLF